MNANISTMLKKNSYFIIKYPKMYKMCQCLPIFLSCSSVFMASVECIRHGLYQTWHINPTDRPPVFLCFSLYNSDSDAGVSILAKHWKLHMYCVVGNLLATWNFCWNVQHVFYTEINGSHFSNTWPMKKSEHFRIYFSHVRIAYLKC